MKTKNNFEIYILRPLHIVSLIFVLLFLVKGAWFWMIVALVVSFCIGMIGQDLHPLQSTSDLAKGPTTNPAAIDKNLHLPDVLKKILVSRACTKVGMLIGFVTGVILVMYLGWHWYFALPIAFVALVFSGGLLKFLFK